MTTPSSDSLLCPVCERTIERILVWQDPDSERIRMFCEDCAGPDEYRSLPVDQRTSFDLAGFDRFAGRRLLLHVLQRERDKRAGATGTHVDG